MRGAVDGLRSAHPLVDLLPSVYLEDDLARGFTEGLDPGSRRCSSPSTAWRPTSTRG